jgi:hypothetical protein
MINNLKMEMISICKIPTAFPFTKGGITPLWQSGARGDFPMPMSIQF